jgi:hypothetical protein
MALSGVRSSWLIEERNSLLAEFAVSAAARASRKSSASRASSVKSQIVFTKPPEYLDLAMVTRVPR